MTAGHIELDLTPISAALGLRRVVFHRFGENDGMVFGKAFAQLSKPLIRANIEKFIAGAHYTIETGLYDRRMLMSYKPILVPPESVLTRNIALAKQRSPLRLQFFERL